MNNKNNISIRKYFRRSLCSISAAVLSIFTIATTASAQEKIDGTVEFDRLVCDFGDVLMSDGPLDCRFTMKNIGSKPVVIYNVSTTCGCTDVKWSREPVMPGKTAVISVTYTNDEGPYPFDKSLTAHISGLKKPVILKIRGVSHQKEEPLDIRFPVHNGKLGLKSTELKCGNLEMGGSKSEEVQIANLGSSPMKVSFTEVSEGLDLEVEPNPVPAGATATLHFKVTSLDGVWGKNHYFARPVIDGSPARDKLDIFAYTKACFDNLTTEERVNGPKPMFQSSTYSFGKVKAGTGITARWEFTNMGKSALKVYKVDVEAPVSTHSEIPDVAANGKGSLTVNLDTSGMPQGEALVIVTLTTNSPIRPIVNLFITGWIE